MKHQYIDSILYFCLYEDPDNLTVCNLEQICIDLIEKYQPRTVRLDSEEVTFVDSTSIGLALARYKQLQKLYTQFILRNLSRANQTLSKTSGIFQIMKHEKNEVEL